MAEELSKDELELLARHRAEKAKNSRKVTVKGKHAESGAEYEFSLDGDEAERVVSRHRSLFEEEPEEGKAGAGAKKPAEKSAGTGHPYFQGKKE
jgi:hypothetical protein